MTARSSTPQSRALRVAIALTVMLLWVRGLAYAYRGTVTDVSTGRAIEGAFVTLNGTVVRTDRQGRFELEGRGEVLGVRSYGYLRTSLKLTPAQQTYDVALTPFRPKALYLSFFGIGSAGIRGTALNLVEATELNALVIDVKGDHGMIAYKSGIPLAAKVGAQNVTTIGDIRALLQGLHAKGIYTVARIVVFKDNPLAMARPDLAVRSAQGTLFRDREHLAWTDPFNREVWEYNIAVAVEAARHGFDEIQFDYLRFPDARGIVLSQPNTERNRVAAISGFLERARTALTPYNVFLAADIFGYVTWNLDDTHIGQKLEEIVSRVDYISPMLYPSCFQFGIPGYRNPVAHPHQIVALSLGNARQRTGLSPLRFRPWLQAFRDYAFDRRRFGGAEIRAQISAAEDFGSDGWMLWNPNNRYSEEGLKK